MSQHRCLLEWLAHLNLQLLLPLSLLSPCPLPACQVLYRLLRACQLLLLQVQVLAAAVTQHAAADPGC
jgi:hypothetical protein